MLPMALVIVLPALATAKISIYLKAGENVTHSEVHYKGNASEVIPDEERNQWGLSDDGLKDAAYYFSGGKPDQVFVKSPTPWNDLYVRYVWKQVEKIVVPISAKILNIQTQPTLLIGRAFINISKDMPADKKFDVYQNVKLLISNSRNRGNNLPKEQEIFYEINFSAGSTSTPRAISMSYNACDRQYKPRENYVSFGNSIKIEKIHSSRAVRADLYAQKSRMKVLVKYKTFLSGYVACNYENKYEGHHFKAYNINDCLAAAGLPKEFCNFENINVEYYSNGKLVITDIETSQKIMEVPVLVL